MDLRIIRVNGLTGKDVKIDMGMDSRITRVNSWTYISCLDFEIWFINNYELCLNWAYFNMIRL